MKARFYLNWQFKSDNGLGYKAITAYKSHVMEE
jgi:hypothetical protein